MDSRDNDNIWRPRCSHLRSPCPSSSSSSSSSSSGHDHAARRSVHDLKLESLFVECVILPKPGDAQYEAAGQMHPESRSGRPLAWHLPTRSVTVTSVQLCLRQASSTGNDPRSTPQRNFGSAEVTKKTDRCTQTSDLGQRRRWCVQSSPFNVFAGWTGSMGEEGGGCGRGGAEEVGKELGVNCPAAQWP